MANNNSIPPEANSQVFQQIRQKRGKILTNPQSTEIGFLFKDYSLGVIISRSTGLCEENEKV